jgi:hypothetical protein
LIKPAVEREALQGGVGARKQRVAPTPKMVDQDSGQVTEGETIDERQLATSRKRFVQAGGEVGETKVRRSITTPADRNASSKEALSKTQEHLGVLEAHANTHYGAIQTAAKAVPEAHSTHGAATRSIGTAHTQLAFATTAFAERNSAKGNEHIKNANNALIAAHGSLNSTAVRSVTGGEVPLHIDELKSWKSHISNLPTFRRKGKPFSEVNVGGTRLRTGSRAVDEVAAGAKGTMLGDKVERAKRGTPRTPKWERGETGRPTTGEKGTGVVDTTSRGTNAGTTGEMDPRRKASSKTTVRMTIAKPNLPKIGDTIRKPKKK